MSKFMSKFLNGVCFVIESCMRFKCISDRRGQVWQREWVDSKKEQHVETIIVISEPYPIGDTNLERLLSKCPIWARNGWLHKTLEIELGTTSILNEEWFGSWSDKAFEVGDPYWKRIT